VISPARALAFEVIRATFEEDAFTERAFRKAADEQGLAGRERAQAQRLAYGAVQRRGTSDAAIARLAERPPARLDPPVLASLRLGLYELLFADATPDHAAVDQAVELLKRAGAPHAAGFANAVLRRAVRERDGLTASLLGDDSTPERASIAHSAPRWLAEMWWEQLGPQAARSLLAAANEPAEVAMRVNTLRGEREAMLAELGEAGVSAEAPRGAWPLAAEEMIVVSGRTGTTVPERVVGGALTPQSRGSAAVVEVLDPRPGERVLDLCAGPGIKTGQIAARMADRGESIAVELDPLRAAEIAAQAERLGLRSVSVIEADAAELEGLTGFDRVLLDAPCSDLGALASRPDLRWRKSPQTIERLVEAQEGMLRRAAQALRPGGVLVYSTCTISRREAEDQVGALLAGSGSGGVPAMTADDLGSLAPDLASTHDPRCLQLLSDRDCTTGFSITRLRRHD
jgi:16S rRNA (cytosine967-C5)-methyltransferase